MSTDSRRVVLLLITIWLIGVLLIHADVVTRIVGYIASGSSSRITRIVILDLARPPHMKTLTWLAIFHIHPPSITLAAIAGNHYISFLVSPRRFISNNFTQSCFEITLHKHNFRWFLSNGLGFASATIFWGFDPPPNQSRRFWTKPAPIQCDNVILSWNYSGVISLISPLTF